MLKKFGLIDVFFEIDKGAEKRALGGEVFRIEYDFLFCIHRSFRSACISRKIRAKTKVGYRDWWNFIFFDRRFERPMRLPEAFRQLALLQEIDPPVAAFLRQNKMEQPWAWSRMLNTGPIPEWADMGLSLAGTTARLPPGRWAFLAPGSVWPTKRWKAEGFVRVARELRAKGFGICLVGAPGEEEIAKSIENQVPGCLNYCGKTSLFEMYELFREGEILICNDSGAMHMAAVAGLPTVAVFGPTTKELGYRPWQDRAVIVEKDLPCRPCGKHGGRRCPIGTHECMEAVDARQVVDEAMRLIAPRAH